MGFIYEYYRSISGNVYKLINLVFASNKSLTSRIPLIVYQCENGVHYTETQQNFDLFFSPTNDKKLINKFKKSLKKNLNKIDQNECEMLTRFNSECSTRCKFCKNKDY